MTLGEIIDDMVNRAGDTGPTSRSRAKEFVNDILFRISDDCKYPGQRREGVIRTVTGQFSYPLSPDVADVIEPMTVVENNRNIFSKALSEFNTRIQNPTTTGDPNHFIYYGNFGVEKQPETKLRFVSSSTSDTQTATVYGLSEFRAISESVTLTGTSGVLTTNAYSEVDRIVLSSVAVGTITATGNSTSGNNDLPVVGTNGDLIVGTIAAAATEFTVHDPASFVRLKSTSGSDTAHNAIIKGYGIITSGSTPFTIDADKVYIEETLALNGASEVESSSRFTRIDSISIDADLNGNLKMYADPGALLTLIGVIPSKKRSLDIPMIGLYPIPNTGRIRYNYYQKLTPLTSDGDRPPMDERVHRYIKKWSESAFLAWFGSSMGIQETIQNSLPSWQSDMRTIRNILGITANKTTVVGGRAATNRAGFRPSAILDPSTYGNE